jgi:putative transposase
MHRSNQRKPSRPRIFCHKISNSPTLPSDQGYRICDGLLEVAKPATYKRWLAQARGGCPFKAVGRPRLTRGPRDVVVRIGSENLLWGYKRIVGELKKLGLHAGANSVRRILDDAGIHPSPERR